MSDSNLFKTLENTTLVTEQIAVDCTAIQGLCELPLGNELLDAAFSREGHDLLVAAPSKLVIAESYFTHEASPTLISQTGLKVMGSSVDTLTSAEAPTEYAGPINAQAAIGTVDKLDGSVTVKRGGVDVELNSGDSVFQNDVVQTATDAKIGITFEDGSVFTLGSEARMTLDSFVYDAETGDGSSSINVIKGMFKFVSGEIAANNPGEMQVETPVATIGIRGTTGGGSVQGEGMDNDFYLEPNADGTVGWFDVTTDSGTTSMNQPNTVIGITSFKETPPAPEFVPHEQIEKNFNEVIDFAPEGKYETRENAEQEEATTEQVEAKAQAKEEIASDESIENTESAEEEVSEQIEAEAETTDETISEESIEDTASTEEITAAEAVEEAPQNEGTISTTVASEARNTADAVAASLSPPPQIQLANTANIANTAATETITQASQTVEEIVDTSRTELLNEILTSSPEVEEVIETVAEEVIETAAEATADITPPVIEETTIEPIVEEETAIVQETEAAPEATETPPAAAPVAPRIFNIEDNSSNEAYGTNGVDIINVTTSDITVNARDGDDIITLNKIAEGRENILVDAGAGDDVIIISNHAVQENSIHGGEGYDTLDLSGVNPVNGVIIADGQVTHSTGTIVSESSGIESYITGDRGDNITLSDANEMIHAGAGDDTINAGAGDDIIISGAGNDILDGGAGIDTASYEDAINGIEVSLTSIEGANVKNDGFGNTDSLSNIESIIGSGHDDLLIADTSIDNLTAFDAGLGNDTLKVEASTDGSVDLTHLAQYATGFETLDLSNENIGDNINLSSLTADQVQSISGSNNLTIKIDGQDNLDLSTDWVFEPDFSTYTSGDVTITVEIAT